MALKRKLNRVVRPVVLIVGEGYAEDSFLRHIRSLYTDKHQGAELKPGNARGKGAKNVIDYAIRLSERSDYDCVAALFDTDTDWTDAVRKRGEAHNIAMLLSEPCLEAWLLAVVGLGREGTTQQQKESFLACFGAAADAPNLFTTHFPRKILDAARPRVEVLDKLLSLLGV